MRKLVGGKNCVLKWGLTRYTNWGRRRNKEMTEDKNMDDRR